MKYEGDYNVLVKGMVDLEERKKAMAKCGVDVQVISLSTPGVVREAPELGIRLAKLTNDAFGYILTKVDFNSFPRYEYVSRTSLGEMTGEILIEQSLAIVRKSPRPGRAD